MSDPNVEKEAGSTQESNPDVNQPDAPEPEKRKREYKDFGHDHDDKPTRKYQFAICSVRSF